MAYSDFTLTQLASQFGIQVRTVTGTFDSAPPVLPSAFLQMAFERGMPIALGKAREKARSETLVTPVLLEVKAILDNQISVFSGVDFTVDRKQKLSGFCDFLLSRSPLQIEVDVPVVVIVEAKHEDLNEGIAQCLAEMHAAQLYNAERGKPTNLVYGATTTGMAWRFLRLTGNQAEVDMTEYHISQVEKVLGILVMMVQ